ncbi:MAG: hypothetical protein M3016_04760 [Actinomycetota bacterium]|nr:hypothetical protein [Actinomycetota bacterium]
MSLAGRLVAVAAAASTLAGCGLDVRLPDLFLLTRTGQGTRLTLLVNDAGTMSCNGAAARRISSARLISARDLADSLAADARRHLRLPARRNAVYSFRVRLQPGTISFSDRDTVDRRELAQAVLFATQAAQQVCGRSG